KKSGDNIVEQACHIIDLMVWAAGSPPQRCFGSGGINLYVNEPMGRTTMDNYSVIYEWANGTRFNFSHIYFDPAGFSGIKERVYGSEGAVDLATATYHPLGKKEQIKLRGEEAPASTRDEATYKSLEAFLDNARGKKKPLNDIISARTSTMVAIMGRKSIYERRVIEWKDVARG
ncbi:MAG: hypothetical protein K2Q23_15600, partial [Bryobacteraceae bacterium]|nr:hypothetical protein [Bryobacteraceae bacterium]